MFVNHQSSIFYLYHDYPIFNSYGGPKCQCPRAKSTLPPNLLDFLYLWICPHPGVYNFHNCQMLCLQFKVASGGLDRVIILYAWESQKILAFKVFICACPLEPEGGAFRVVFAGGASGSRGLAKKSTPIWQGCIIFQIKGVVYTWVVYTLGPSIGGLPNKKSGQK